jgi:macrolide-specific efflux system membrane fusion protein
MKVARCELRSPIDGVVVEILHNKGEWLDPGEPLVRILTLNPLRVEFFVAASRYGQAELIGHQVELETQLPGDKKGLFAGEIVFVSPEIQPVNGQIRVYAEVQNPEYLLRPGARGKLTIQLDNE